MTYTAIGKILIPIYIPFSNNVELSLKWFIRSLLVDFDIEKIDILSTSRRFTEISIIGKDAKTAISFLTRYFGGEISWKDVEFDSEIPGRVLRVEDEKILVDIGLKEDDYFKVAVNNKEIVKKIYHIEKKVSSDIIKSMGIDRYFPFSIIIRQDSTINHEKREIEGSIGRSTIRFVSKWLKSRFDRLVIYGATRSAVLKAIKSTGHLRDIVNIERVGFLENAVVCKWGTSAVGLIPEIGEYLPKAKFIAVKPRFLKKQLRNL